MANYLVPTTFTGSLSGEEEFTGFYKMIRTFGRRPPARLSPDEKVSKARLSNDLWKQLDAVSKGTWVNHLGRGHTRMLPIVSERQHEEKVNANLHCLACVYGHSNVYLHTCNKP